MPIEMPPGLPFAVDTWGRASRLRRRIRFLSHAHRDHLAGAASASAAATGTVYATRLTMSLALRHFPQLERSGFVEMEIGKTVVVDDPHGAFSVTAYDANHCPGAVMFLFESEFGSILHTGDCRLTPECLQNLPLKYITKKGKENACRLDFVFLDCTFSRCFLKLPSKQSAIQQVINCVWKHPHAPHVYLACDLLGHEEILVEVSRTFGSKIFVDSAKNSDCFQALLLTAPEILSADPSCRFQVVGFHQLYERASEKLEQARANLQPEHLFIRPSTQWYARSARTRKPSLTEAEQDEFGVWHVCFSIHSSRDELECALQLLQPQWVISTTPPCFAMDLSYVKKHCFKTRLTVDDPLWKIFQDPLRKTVSSPSLVAVPEISIDDDLSTSVDEECTSESDHQLCLEDLDVRTLELKFEPSPSLQEPQITLFGRARFGPEAIDVLKEEQHNQCIAIEEANLVCATDKEAEACSGSDLVVEQVSVSQPENVAAGSGASFALDEAAPVQSLSIDEGETSSEVVVDKLEKSEVMAQSESSGPAECSRAGEIRDFSSDVLGVVGSSKCFSASLKKLYRSRNVPVPRPLPSLVGLLESSKRVKMRPSANYSSLNSWHSLP